MDCLYLLAAQHDANISVVSLTSVQSLLCVSYCACKNLHRFEPASLGCAQRLTFSIELLCICNSGVIGARKEDGHESMNTRQQIVLDKPVDAAFETIKGSWLLFGSVFNLGTHSQWPPTCISNSSRAMILYLTKALQTDVDKPQSQNVLITCIQHFVRINSTPDWPIQFVTTCTHLIVCNL